MHLDALHRPRRRLPQWPTPALREERGYTLVELLVACVAAIVVMAAMGAIVITTVQSNASLTDRVDSNQAGRVAMEKITQQLNSACVANQVPPVIADGATGPTGSTAVSDATHLWFYSAIAPGTDVTDAPTINPSLVDIYLSGSSLVETAYPWLSGTAPEPTNATPWTFNWNAPTNFTLLPNASAPSGGTGPIFQYYGYTAGTGTIASTPFATPLSSTNAAATAEVAISFTALPSDNDSGTLGRGSDISDSVVFRLTPASALADATNTPCS